MSRVQSIIAELTQHLTETGLGIDIRSIEQWQDQTPLGWAWPAIYRDDGLEVRICPELIDAQTVDLSDEDLQEYLDVIEWVCDSHVLFAQTESDPAARQVLIEDELYELYPGALDRWFAMRVAALD